MRLEAGCASLAVCALAPDKDSIMPGRSWTCRASPDHHMQALPLQFYHVCVLASIDLAFNVASYASGRCQADHRLLCVTGGSEGAEGSMVLLLAPSLWMRPGLVLLGCVVLWQQAVPVHLHQDSLARRIHPPHPGVDPAQLLHFTGGSLRPLQCHSGMLLKLLTCYKPSGPGVHIHFSDN